MRKVDLERNYIRNDIGVTKKVNEKKEDINMFKNNLKTILQVYLAMFGIMFIGVVWMFVKVITILFN